MINNTVKDLSKWDYDSTLVALEWLRKHPELMEKVHECEYYDQARKIIAAYIFENAPAIDDYFYEYMLFNFMSSLDYEDLAKTLKREFRIKELLIGEDE